jgi:hypothetical protein
MDDLFELGQQALSALPFSRFLGAQLTIFRPGEAGWSSRLPPISCNSMASSTVAS